MTIINKTPTPTPAHTNETPMTWTRPTRDAEGNAVHASKCGRARIENWGSCYAVFVDGAKVDQEDTFAAAKDTAEIEIASKSSNCQG